MRWGKPLGKSERRKNQRLRTSGALGAINRLSSPARVAERRFHELTPPPPRLPFHITHAAIRVCTTALLCGGSVMVMAS